MNMLRRIVKDPASWASVAFVVILPLVISSIVQATEVLIFSSVALACNLMLGYVGFLSFAQSAFLGVGAYACGYLLVHFGVGFFTAIIFATVAAAAAGALVGFMATQQRGIYGVMLTLALSQMFYFVAYAASDVTGGDNGMSGIIRPAVSIFGNPLFRIDDALTFYVTTGLFFVLVCLFLRRLIASPFGAVLIAIRENEERAIAIGYNTRLFKTLAFVVSAIITGGSGALYAMFLSFAPLSNIDTSMGEKIVIMTVLGGSNSFFGPVLGATAYVLLSNVLSTLWARWLLLLGVVLIVIAGFLRGGLWSIVAGAANLIVSAWGRRSPATAAPAAEERGQPL
jgi:branched-chain amino acid transport system permease protein